MATPKIEEVKQNEELVHRVIETEPKQVSGYVGIHALMKLAQLLSGEEFLQFVNETVEEANQAIGNQQTPSTAVQ